GGGGGRPRRALAAAVGRLLRTAAGAMSRFVESFATQQLLPPWKATQAHVSGFVIRLDAARIQTYLDTYFNGAYPDAAPYQYRILPFDQQYGLLSVCFYPNVRSMLRTPGSHPVSGGR